MIEYISEELEEKYVSIAKKYFFEKRGWNEEDYTIYFSMIQTERNAAWLSFEHNVAKKEYAELKKKYGNKGFLYHNNEYTGSVIVDIIDEKVIENRSDAIFPHAGQPCPIEELPVEQRVKKDWRDRRHK